MGCTVEFVNHASVLVSDGTVALLSDPWYRGDAFHKGWNLLVETDDAAAAALLDRTTHIWLSHEHPDHFSVPFFKTHGGRIRDRGIEILFQETEDRRVAGFLRGLGLRVTEIPFDRPHALSPDMWVSCLKDGFYDSGLSIRAGGVHVLNLNDCDIDERARAEAVHRVTGDCDILLTQFSYAAWKGNPDNRAWREEAAAKKLDAIALQAEVFRPKTVIPFASFVYFSNARNAFLNDAVNTPRKVMARFAEHPFDVVFLRPSDVFDGTPEADAIEAAVAYWQAEFEAIADKPRLTYASVSEDDLRSAFDAYIRRIERNNARWFMRVARTLSPIRIFRPVAIRLDDLRATFEVDLLARRFARTEGPADLTMASESLHFLFRNTFGFDTLTVNGCFEESAEGGFSKAARSLAIENLNNLGLRFSPALLIEAKLIRHFLSSLASVARHLRRRPA